MNRLGIDCDSLPNPDDQRACQIAEELLAEWDERIASELNARITVDSKREFLEHLLETRRADLSSPLKLTSSMGSLPACSLRDGAGLTEFQYIDVEAAKHICRFSIKWIGDRLKEFESAESEPQSPKESGKEPSGAFIAFAIHYMLKAGNFPVNGKELAKLTSGLSGKGQDNIYKHCLQALAGSDDKQYRKIRLKLKALFQEVGLGEIANLVDKDLN